MNSMHDLIRRSRLTKRSTDWQPYLFSQKNLALLLAKERDAGGEAVRKKGEETNRGGRRKQNMTTGGILIGKKK